MEQKKCPVDRGKLLIGLECHRYDGLCRRSCPYRSRTEVSCSTSLVEDALAYIGWLEAENQRLKDTEPDDAKEGAIIVIPVKAISPATLKRISRDVGGLSHFGFDTSATVVDDFCAVQKEAEDDAGND